MRTVYANAWNILCSATGIALLSEKIADTVGGLFQFESIEISRGFDDTAAPRTAGTVG